MVHTAQIGIIGTSLDIFRQQALMIVIIIQLRVYRRRSHLGGPFFPVKIFLFYVVTFRLVNHLNETLQN